MLAQCTLPIGHECGNHKKLSPVQLAPNRLRILCERVAALNGPGLQDEFVAAHMTEHADGPQPAPGRPHLHTAVVDVLVYIQVNPDDPRLTKCRTDTTIGW